MDRSKGLSRLILGLIAVVLTSGTVTAAPAQAASGHIDYDRTWQLLAITNAERSAHGLPELTMDQPLLDLAVVRVKEIKRAFSHTRPNGQAWSTAFPGSYEMPWGENIGYGQPTAKAVHQRWMGSPLHQANILDPDYRSVGLVAWVEGKSIYWAQEFTSAVVPQIEHPTLTPRVQIELTRPGLTKVAAKAGGGVVVKLRPVAQADGYKILLASNKKFSRHRAQAYLDSTQTRVALAAGLTKGRRYWLKARAFVLVNGKRQYGRWSLAQRFKAR